VTIPLSYRISGRQTDDRPASSEDAGLLTLSRCALRLRGALRTPQRADALSAAVSTYVAAAAAGGISLRRMRDALELFVHEHAPRPQPTSDLLDLVLRLASEAHAASTPRRREAL
jgi:hypothetical protein